MSSFFQVNFDEQLINYAIWFLTEVESKKEWKKPETKNYSMFTCGYTAPGITIIILYFHDIGYNYVYEIENFIPEKRQWVINGINETIGNFFDLAPDCPLSGCAYGIRSLINSTPPVGSPIKWYTKSGIALEYDLLSGPNLITFTTRGYNDSFHHSVIYVPYPNEDNSNDDNCYIIDSWYQDNNTRRPITYRKFKLTDIVNVLIRLNAIVATHSPSEASDIILLLQYYFLAPDESPVFNTIRQQNKISVHLINRDVIYAIMHLSFDHVKRNPSSFGGKYKKHRKIYSKRKKSNNKSKKRKRNVKSVKKILLPHNTT